MFYVNVSRILKDIDLEHLYGAREITAKWKRQALKRAVSLPIPATDISYFLEMKSHGAASYYKAFKLISSRPKIKNFIASFGNRCNKKLTYRLSSQIYEAENLGFSREETIKLLDINEKLYNYAFENEQSIKPVIINAIRVLYPKQEIQHPWIDFNL